MSGAVKLLTFRYESAERLRGALVTMLRMSQDYGAELDIEPFIQARLKPPTPEALTEISRCAAADDADEWIALIALIDAQTDGRFSANADKR